METIQIEFKKDALRCLDNQGNFKPEYVEENKDWLKELQNNKAYIDLMNDYPLFLLQTMANNPSIEIKNRLDSINSFRMLINKVFIKNENKHLSLKQVAR